MGSALATTDISQHPEPPLARSGLRGVARPESRPAKAHDQGSQARWLKPGDRLHLNHGPIDLIVELTGPRPARRMAFRRAVQAFNGVLAGLVGELDLLRQPYSGSTPRPRGAVARRMFDSLAGYERDFVTPMASVAGAVADHMLNVMRSVPGLERISVNNGGDIAVWLGEASHLTVGIVGDPRSGRQIARIALNAGSGVGGIATSGWRGRSFSLGIADAVTVLAENAAAADVAATLIANAVDLPGSAAIRRVPANSLAPDTDLGARLVTAGVSDLSAAEIGQALASGANRAHAIVARRAATSAFINLQGRTMCIGETFGPTATELPTNSDKETMQ